MLGNQEGIHEELVQSGAHTPNWSFLIWEVCNPRKSTVMLFGFVRWAVMWILNSSWYDYTTLYLSQQTNGIKSPWTVSAEAIQGLLSQNLLPNGIKGITF